MMKSRRDRFDMPLIRQTLKQLERVLAPHLEHTRPTRPNRPALKGCERRKTPRLYPGS